MSNAQSGELGKGGFSNFELTDTFKAIPQVIVKGHDELCPKQTVTLVKHI